MTPWHSVLPTPDQELLLRAAFARDAELPDLLAEAERRLVLDELDLPTRVLLPLLHPRVENLDATPLVAACREAYRRNWLANQRLIHRAVVLLGRLADHGIPTLVLKGTALIPSYYRDPGLRFMSDLDVMVPEERFVETGRLMERMGYVPLEHPLRCFDTRFGHAIAYRNREGHDVDLHCHVLPISCERGADEGFWQRAVPLRLSAASGEAATRSLAASDLLLHTCVHGVVWVKTPHNRWVADALVILRERDGRIDWDGFVETADARGVAGLATWALGYLRERFDAAVPDAALGKLERLGRRPSARRVVRFITRQREGYPLAALGFHRYMLSRAVRAEEGSWWVFGRRFLLHWCRVDRPSKVPPALWRKTRKLVGLRLGLHAARQ
ncbi:MAG: nucleotidyltransferase family protein [Acidobacteria bacterium]|nr:nucleotidyltransferase family protein [Acidobacteriota bacterium]